MKDRSLQSIQKSLKKLLQVPRESNDVRGTLQHIAEVAQHFFSADVCVALPYNSINGRYMSMQSIVAGPLQGNVIPYGPPRIEGLAREVFRQEMLLVEDLALAPDYQRPFTLAEGVRSFVALALYTRVRMPAQPRQRLGVLYLNYRKPQQFSPEDRALLRLFANQAAFLLQETWQRKRYQEVMRLSYELNQELSTADELFATVNRRIGNILDASGIFLLAIYSPQTDEVRLLYDEENDSPELAYTSLQNVCRQVIRSQQSLFVRHLSREVEQLAIKLSNYARAELKESLIVLPLLLRDASFGTLLLQHTQPDIYSLEDMNLLQLLASHVALALHNIRLYTNMSQLNEAGQLLNQQIDPEETLQATVDKIRESTRADLVALFPSNSMQARFVLSSRVSGDLLNDDTSLESLLANYDGALVNLMLRHTAPIFAKRSAVLYNELYGPEAGNWQDTFEQRERLRSTAALPLRVNDEAVGVLLLYFRQPQRFDAAQKLLISGLAQYAAVVIKNVQTYGALRQRRMQELITLSNIDRALNRSVELREMLELILNLALVQTPADVATFALYDASKQEFWTAAAVGRQQEARREVIIPLNQQKGIILWVMEHKRPVRINHVRRDRPWCDLYFPASEETVSELDVPLLDGDTLVGVLNFESMREGAFSEEDETFLQTLAGQAVLAVTRSQREKQIDQTLREIESRARVAEEMSTVGQSAFELAHRLGNDLGLLPTHVENIQAELAKLGVENAFISDKLQSIHQSVRKVLRLSYQLKEGLAANSRTQSENNFQAIHPLELLQDAHAAVSIPDTIRVIYQEEIAEESACAWVMPLSVSDILRNLITNAVEAMRDGGKIMLRVYQYDGHIALEVQDTGIGIPEHMTEKIFELFFSTKGSSGFGLWSARMNALRNRGDLIVKSQPGQGATFTLLLPLANGGGSNVR